MSKVIELTDEQYQAIERAAQTRGQTCCWPNCSHR